MKKFDPFYLYLAVGLLIGLPLIGYLGWEKTQVIASGCHSSPVYQWACGWYRWMAESPFNYGVVLVVGVAVALSVPFLQYKLSTNKFKKKS